MQWQLKRLCEEAEATNPKGIKKTAIAKMIWAMAAEPRCLALKINAPGDDLQAFWPRELFFGDWGLGAPGALRAVFGANSA